MEFLGIGPLELILIILLALVILGPKEMEKMSKTIGKNLNKLIKSDVWKDIQNTSDKVKNLPTELMRNAELEDLEKSLHAPLDETAKIAPPSRDINKNFPSLQQDQVIIPSPQDDQNIAPPQQDQKGAPSGQEGGKNNPSSTEEKTDSK